MGTKKVVDGNNRASKARSSLVDRINCINGVQKLNDEQLKQAARGIIHNVLSGGFSAISKWMMEKLIDEAERRREERKK